MLLKLRIKGRVQGVGFRVFARDAGRTLRLRGYVRNLPDRSLEVVAAGDLDDLNEMLQRMERGPAMARVTEVEREWSETEPRGLPPDFEVRF